MTPDHRVRRAGSGSGKNILPCPDNGPGAPRQSGGYRIDFAATYGPSGHHLGHGADPASPRRVSRLCLAVGVLGVLLAPGVAPAQPTDTAPQGRYLLGSSLSVTPAIAVVTGRDTNAIRTDTGSAAGEVYVVPQIEGWLGRGRLRLNFANAVEFSRQQTAGQLGGRTVLNHYHVGRLAVGGPRLALEALADYRDHYAPPTDFVGFEQGLKSRRIERELGASLLARPGGRITFRANAGRSSLRYDADVRFRGASLQQSLNRNITSFAGEAQLALTPLSSASISVNTYSDRFLFSPDRDGNGLRALVGGVFSPRALLSGRADVGYLRYVARQSGARFGGPAYNLGLSFSRSPLFVDVSGRRWIDFSFDPGQGFYVSNGVDVFSVLSLGAAWEGFGRASLRGLSPRGPLAAREPFRIIESYKTGLVRRFGRWTRLGVDAERYVTGGPGGFSGLRTTMFLIYGSTRLQRLDRPLPGGF